MINLQENEIDRFIVAIRKSFSGMDLKTSWPLSGAQMDAYFDVDESLDMYYRLTTLRKTKSIEEIASLLPAPDVLRLFLQHNAIIGLKVAKKLKIADITTKQRVDYTLLLFEILKHTVKNDIFCLDGENILLNNDEISSLCTQTKWDIPKTEVEKKEVAYLNAIANSYCYSLYFDAYMAGGFYIHGPYDAHSHFGKGCVMVVRDYYNLKPREVWDKLSFKHNSIKLYLLYQNIDMKINFVNHPITLLPLGSNLIRYKIYVDDKSISLGGVAPLIDTLEKSMTDQMRAVNALGDLDQVRQGIKIGYYLFKDFREKMGDDWHPPKEIEKTITKFGDTFIKKFKYAQSPSLDHWAKLFDPRNDYY